MTELNTAFPSYELGAAKHINVVDALLWNATHKQDEVKYLVSLYRMYRTYLATKGKGLDYAVGLRFNMIRTACIQYAYLNDLQMVCAIDPRSVNAVRDEAECAGIEWDQNDMHAWFCVSKTLTQEQESCLNMLRIRGVHVGLLWKEML